METTKPDTETSLRPERIEQGTVTRTFPQKGYMWIGGDDRIDYFGHLSQVQNTERMSAVVLTDPVTGMKETFHAARIGQRCRFIPDEGDRGPLARLIVLEP